MGCGVSITIRRRLRIGTRVRVVPDGGGSILGTRIRIHLGGVVLRGRRIGRVGTILVGMILIIFWIL